MEKEKIVVVVCVIYFAAMILIGIIAARRNKATSDYLGAGRRLNRHYAGSGTDWGGDCVKQRHQWL